VVGCREENDFFNPQSKNLLSSILCGNLPLDKTLIILQHF